MSLVQLSYDGLVAMIVFNHPTSRVNVMSTAAWTALGDALNQIEKDDRDFAAVVIASVKEGVFIAGADLKELAALPTDDDGPATALVAAGHRVLAALEDMPRPTIAVIDGACLGGGLEVALACDYRVVERHPRVKLGFPEVKLGLIPGWGGTQRLPRLIGAKAAAEMLVTGRPISAEEAIACGLADVYSEEIGSLLDSDPSERRRTRALAVDGAADLAEARALADALPDDEKTAALVALRVMEQGMKRPIEDALQVEAQAFVPLLATDAVRGRIAKFLKK